MGVRLGRGSSAGRSKLQQISRFLWVSHDAVVLRCTTATDARRLCSQLQTLSSSASATGSQGSSGMTTLGGGLRCHIQWCSAPVKDLNEQQDAIEAVVRARCVRMDGWFLIGASNIATGGCWNFNRTTLPCECAATSKSGSGRCHF